MRIGERGRGGTARSRPSRTRRAARVARVAAALALSTTAVACGDVGGRGGRGGSIDTLADGAVRVSNPARGLWDEGEAWSLVEDLRLGTVEGDGPELFGRISDLEVDAGGRIYVLDSQTSEVRIFGPDGTHVGTFGRPGEGPGELKQPRGIEFGPAGHVWIADLGNQRYTVIDSTGALIEERRRFTGGNVVPWPGTILADGRVIDVDLVSTDEGLERLYTLHSPDGTLLDTVPMPSYDGPSFTHTSESSRISANVPFSPRLERAWDPTGGIWAGVPEEYRVVHTELTGDTTLILEREYEPVPVTGAEADAAIENMEWFTSQGGRVDRSRIPDEHPAYRGLHPDREGYLWVVPTTPREGEVTADNLYAPRPSDFDVFDPAGRYLGRMRSVVPLARPIITGSHVYGLTTDELGVPYVVRLRIQGR